MWADSDGSIDTQKTTLLTQLAHGRWKERIQAADELARHREETVVEALVKALKKDRSYRVRWSVVDALGALGGPKATAAIMRALDDKDWEAQAQAAENLGNLGAKEASEPLIQLLGQISEWLLRVYIVDSMWDIGDQRFIPCPAYEDARSRVRWPALRRLA
jgi:HEAT repeat protein